MKNLAIKRDLNVVAHLKGEISLSTRVVRDRSKYTRKQKHKLRYV